MAHSGEGGEEKVESMTETVSVKVTPSQKRDVTMVAALEETDVSSLLREFSLNDILAKAERFREQNQATTNA